MKKPTDIGWSFLYLGTAASQLPVLVLASGHLLIINAVTAIFGVMFSIITAHRYSNLEERNA